MKVQSGFVLISVLLITTVSSIAAFTAITEANVQERMAGQHNKEANARALSEKGVIEAKKVVEILNLEKMILDDIAIELNKISNVSYEINNAKVTGNQISYISTGKYQQASAYLQARLYVNNGNGPFDSAVVGCDGVVLAGSGDVDSYDSSLGPYDPDFKNTNGDVQTINSNADITLSGNAPIHGNILANGDFSSVGSASVVGNVTASGNVKMTGGVDSEANLDRISGNVYAGGDLDLSGTTPIGGNADIVGNVDYVDGSTIAGDLTYAGNITGPTEDHSGLANSINNQGVAAPHFEDEVCDPLNIKDATADLFTLPSNGKMDTGYSQTAGQDYHFTPQSAEMFDTVNQVLDQHPAQNATVLGEADTPVHVFDDFALKTGQINVSGGDVTVVVNGSFISSGGASKITVEAGSSLTLIVAEKVVMGSDAQMIANGTITDTGKAPVNLYSVYESQDTAIKMAGLTDTYANIYAPLGNVDITASGDLMGAIRGKTVDITGDGNVHFDETLADIAPPANNNAISYQSVAYYYP